MGYARKSQVCLEATPYYHVIARCVRRAWLYGVDEYTGKDYSHRKGWVLERLNTLSEVFAVDLCAYAVMSNHFHLVIHVDRAAAMTWSLEQVVQRWSKLFSIPPFVQQWLDGDADDVLRDSAAAIAESWRENLCNLSWYMRCLNEHLARRANAEDGCTGRFWEGRFKCKALLDEAGLLTAMAYVDLNPVRAGIAATPEQCEFTSAYARIRALQSPAEDDAAPQLVRLLPFQDQKPAVTSRATPLPLTQREYLQLVDWSGRIVHEERRRPISKQAPPILERLNIDPEIWCDSMRVRGHLVGRALGRIGQLRLHARMLGQSWIQGLRRAARLYRTA